MDFLKDILNLLIGNNQRDTLILRQSYVIIKFCLGILLELSKSGLFQKNTLEINQEAIDQYYETAKKNWKEPINSEVISYERLL